MRGIRLQSVHEHLRYRRPFRHGQDHAAGAAGARAHLARPGGLARQAQPQDHRDRPPGQGLVPPARGRLQRGAAAGQRPLGADARTARRRRTAAGLPAQPPAALRPGADRGLQERRFSEAGGLARRGRQADAVAGVAGHPGHCQRPARAAGRPGGRWRLALAGLAGHRGRRRFRAGTTHSRFERRPKRAPRCMRPARRRRFSAGCSARRTPGRCRRRRW